VEFLFAVLSSLFATVFWENRLRLCRVCRNGFLAFAGLLRMKRGGCLLLSGNSVNYPILL